MQKKIKVLIATVIVGAVSATGVMATTGVLPNPKNVTSDTAAQLAEQATILNLKNASSKLETAAQFETRKAANLATIGDTPESRATGKPGPHIYTTAVPTYKANATSTFMSKDAVLSLNKDNSKLISIVLETFGAHMLADDPGSNSGEIEDGRMVYVEKVAVGDGYNTIKAGIYDNATVTITLDAETGKKLEASVNGKLRPGTDPHSMTAPAGK